MMRTSWDLAAALVLLCMAGGAVACWAVSDADTCCEAKGLNTKRMCGLFEDVPCADIVWHDEGHSEATRASSGLTGWEYTGARSSCTMQRGYCVGLIGANLCEYREPRDYSCRASIPVGADCDEDPPSSGGVPGVGGEPWEHPHPVDRPVNPAEEISFSSL